jgi:hypothetical protein
MNDTDITEVIARILALVEAKTSKLNPTGDEIGLLSMFAQVCGEFPDISADYIEAAFFAAQSELNRRFYRQQAAMSPQSGTRH